jgi:uncharacterized membrane protein
MTSEGERLARALGALGVGLGLTRLLAPRAVGRAIGLKDDNRNRKTMRAFGVREMATVIGAAVVGVTILDIVAGMRLRRPADGAPGISVRKMITVDNSAEEAYDFWRNFENLPRFMAHLESVRVMDQRRSYWKAKAPLGATVEWVAEITEDRPNQLIAWRSLESASVPHAGQVRFVPALDRRGTEVHVELTHAPPGGIIGATIAKLFGEEPSRQMDDDLRRFKEVLQAP